MKKRDIFKLLFLSATMALCSCNDFLDELPDNRAELDSAEKINKLLVSAYPSRSYVIMCEFASDNNDDAGEANHPGSGVGSRLYHNSYWMDMNEAENDSNINTWQAYYNCIGVANTALQAIEDLGTPVQLLPAKGEALLCRAYAHFCLTMLYCLPYHPEKASEYLGITYLDAPETTLNPTYVRDNLEYVYEHIAADIEAGIPLISDDNYSVPKYHFNRAAACAFASRFYLYYMKWDKVVKYANEVLGVNPASLMCDWEQVSQLLWDGQTRCRAYIDTSKKHNLMMIPLVSNAGNCFFAWSGTANRFPHNNRVCKCETFRAKRPMGGPFDLWKKNASFDLYRHAPFQWEDNITNKVYMPKWYPYWEVTDAVTGVGIGRSVFVAFTTNETILNRAEAYIHLKEYDKAVDDMEIWAESIYKVGQQGVEPLTRERINEVYGDPTSSLYIEEYTTEKPTSRKPLHPHGFEIEPGEQENMIQCLLFCRRLETLGDGLRWGDVKRYGIVVDRFDDTNYIDDTTTGWTVSATLGEKDLRRAFQIPIEVTSSGGIVRNPRNEDEPGHAFIQ